MREYVLKWTDAGEKASAAFHTVEDVFFAWKMLVDAGIGTDFVFVIQLVI